MEAALSMKRKGKRTLRRTQRKVYKASNNAQQVLAAPHAGICIAARQCAARRRAAALFGSVQRPGRCPPLGGRPPTAAAAIRPELKAPTQNTFRTRA